VYPELCLLSATRAFSIAVPVLSLWRMRARILTTRFHGRLEGNGYLLNFVL
jgi:hypothetical protein